MIAIVLCIAVMSLVHAMPPQYTPGLRSDLDALFKPHWDLILEYRQLAEDCPKFYHRATSDEELYMMQQQCKDLVALAESHNSIIQSVLDEMSHPLHSKPPAEFLLDDPIDYAIDFHEHEARNARKFLNYLKSAKFDDNVKKALEELHTKKMEHHNRMGKLHQQAWRKISR